MARSATQCNAVQRSDHKNAGTNAGTNANTPTILHALSYSTQTPERACARATSGERARLSPEQCPHPKQRKRNTGRSQVEPAPQILQTAFEGMYCVVVTAFSCSPHRAICTTHSCKRGRGSRRACMLEKAGTGGGATTANIKREASRCGNPKGRNTPYNRHPAPPKNAAPFPFLSSSSVSKTADTPSPSTEHTPNRGPSNRLLRAFIPGIKPLCIPVPLPFVFFAHQSPSLHLEVVGGHPSFRAVV